MGVHGLWSILEPIREHRPLSDFDGQCLSVDLGFWVCQMQSAVHGSGSKYKIYLRCSKSHWILTTNICSNLFFRISALLHRNMRLFLVTDGKAPILKQDVMKKRIEKREQNSVQKSDQSRMVNRSRFIGCMKECVFLCAELVRILGLPVYELDGEAEASCAVLNQDGIVSAVFTDDSDAFLYGASVILRNFTLDGKQPTVDCYRMDRIQSELGLDRVKLVCLALLVGCDYGEKGIPGIGKETALRFLSEFSNGHQALSRLRQLGGIENLPEKPAESSVYQRIHMSSILFPNESIPSEYLSEKSVPVLPHHFSWLSPNFRQFTAFMNAKLEWTPQYSVSKIVPLISLWTIKQAESSSKSDGLRPICVVKKRIRNGCDFVEIQWKRLAVRKKLSVPITQCFTVANLEDSLVLIPDEDDELDDLQKSFSNDEYLSDILCTSTANLSLDLDENHLKSIEITQEKCQNNSPLPLMDRLRLKMKIEGKYLSTRN